MSKKDTVNLLSRHDFQLTTWGKVANWSLTIGRWIVVVTELIVILAFISRFKLDQDIINLEDEIAQKQAIIEASADQEEIFRNTQKRLSVLSSATAQDRQLKDTFTQINLSLPVDVVITSMNISDNELSINAYSVAEQATSRAEQSISSFANNLRRSLYFDNVLLTRLNLEGGEEKEILFNITADIVE
jgi:Tfp pilus assembly protein PilN